MFLFPCGGIAIGVLLSPGLVLVGNWKRLIPVPWNEVRDIVKEGLWSRLSRAPTMSNPFRRQAGYTTQYSAKRSHVQLAIQSSVSIILS